MLFDEYYNTVWSINFLSRLFFLILLVNIRQTIVNYDPEDTRELVHNYFNWTIGGLLIAIVIVTKYIGGRIDDIVQISWGIVGLAVAIFVLIYYREKIERE